MVEKGTSSKMPNQLGDTTGNLKRKRNPSGLENSTSRDETPVTPLSPPPQINPIHQAAGTDNRFQHNLAGLYVHIHDVIYTYEAKIEVIEAELTATKERIMNLESTSENLGLECDDYKKALKTAQAELEVLRNCFITGLTGAKENIMNLECSSEKLRSECEDYKKALKTAQAEIEVLRNSAFKAELTAAKERIMNLERTSENLRSECEDYKKALKTSQAEIEVFRNSVPLDPFPIQVHCPNIVASENEAAEVGNPEDEFAVPYTSPSQYDLSSASKTIGHVCLEKGHQEHEKMPHTICGSPQKRHRMQEKLPHSINGKYGNKKDGSRTTTILFSYGSERRELLRKNLDFLASSEPCNANNVEKNSVLLHDTSPQVSRSQNLNSVAENDQEGVSTSAYLQSIDEWLLSSKAFHEGRLSPEVYREKMTTTSKLHTSQQNTPQHHPSAEAPSQGNTSQHTDSNCNRSLTNGSGGHEEVNELTICQTERKTGKSSKGTDSSSRGIKSPGLQKPVAENNQEGVLTRVHVQSINEWLLSSKTFQDSMLFPKVYRKKMTTTSELPTSERDTPQHHPSADSPPQGNTSQLTNVNCIESLRNGPGDHEEVNELMLSVCHTERTTGKGSKGTASTSVGVKSPGSQKPVSKNNQEGISTRAHVQSIDELKKMTATSTLSTSQRNTPQHHPSAESPSQGNTCQLTDSNCIGSLRDGSGGHEEVNELMLPICQTERKTGKSSKGTDSSSLGVKSPGSQKLVAENNQEGVSTRAHLQYIDDWLRLSKAFHEGTLFPEVSWKKMTTTSKLPTSQQNTPQHHPSAESPSQGNTSQHTSSNCIEILRNGSSGLEEVNELMLSICQTKRKTGKSSKRTDSSSRGVKSPESQKPVAENNQEGVSTRAHLEPIDEWLRFSKDFHGSTLFPEIYGKKMITTSKLPKSQRNTPQHHPSGESPSQGNTSLDTNSNCIQSLRNGSNGHEEMNEEMLSICQTERKTGKTSRGTDSSSLGVKSPGSQNRTV